MWLMTSFGILMPAIRPPHTVEKTDNRTIQVRTRRHKDLEILRDEFMGDELGPTWHTPSFDYNYRAYCTPEAWARACYALALEVDFEKFKPTTESKYKDAELHSVYNSIWGTVTRLGKPYEARTPSNYSGYNYNFGSEERRPSTPSGYVWDRGEHSQAAVPVSVPRGISSEPHVKKFSKPDDDKESESRLLIEPEGWHWDGDDFVPNNDLSDADAEALDQNHKESLYEELADVPEEEWQELLSGEEWDLVKPRVEAARKRIKAERKRKKKGAHHGQGGRQATY